MNQVNLEQLRSSHRLSDHATVIDTLRDQVGENPQYDLLYALALVMSGDNETGQPLLVSLAEHTEDPEDPDWRSDLALAMVLMGKLDRAEQLLDFVTVDSSLPKAVDFGRLAAVRLALGDLDKATQYYQEAVDREPGRVHWHHNLAGVLLRQQRLEDALEQYTIALGIDSEFQNSVQARRQLLSALDQTEALVEELEAKLAEDPENLPIRLQLSRALAQDGRFTDGLRVLADSLLSADDVEEARGDEDSWPEVRDQQLQLMQQQVEHLLQRSMNGPAYQRLCAMEKLEPESLLSVHTQQVNALIELRRLEEAEELLTPLLEEYADSNQLKIIQSHWLNESGKYDEAEVLLRELLEIYPGNAALLTNLGQTLMWVGKLDEAAECYEKASDINPMALAQMVKARKIPDNPAAIEKMQTIAENRMMAREPRATMSFALAEIHDKSARYEQAAHFLTLGNELVDRDLKYNAEQFSKRVSAMERVYTKEFFDGLEAIRDPDRTPIFVVGMPRSGTTLTEQILCSHPDVFGAGELELLPVLTRLMPRVLKAGPYPACARAMDLNYREEAARYYLYGMKQHDEEHHYMVDKMPHNFMNLGLIATILPKAKIIHIQRDPRDNALSNLQQNFKAKDGGMGYAFNLENLADQINDYHRMMNHWREVLPVPFFELTYEKMVDDQEGMTRQLLDFVGIEWDDSVRDFHKTERAVRTASVSQVRQPIYKTSKQKWKRYESMLQPLLERLQPEVLEPWQ